MLFFIKLFTFLAALTPGQLYDGDFGHSAEPWSGIINGDPVLPSEWLPMLVTINMNATKVELMGSGVVLTEDYILTAGHLFVDFEDEDFANVLIGYGSLDRSKQTLLPARRIYSNYFNLTTRLDDIALIYVPGIGRETLSRTPVKVAIKDMTSLSGVESNLTLTGWGTTSRLDRRHPAIVLKRATLQGPFPIANCSRKLLTDRSKAGLQHVVLSSESQICLHSLKPTDSTKQTACYGDSGSPVFQLAHNELHLYGLVSWGNSTCSLDYPNVFTKLYHYRELIQNKTGFSHWLS